jgi:hypothetical protein
MKAHRIGALIVTALLLSSASVMKAQQRRTSAGGEQPPAGPSIPRDAKFPYAGEWQGIRTMPMGAGGFALRLTVVDGKYSGAMIMPNGNAIPAQGLKATAAGITWDSPNSGGGTWAYTMRLVAPDSIAGTVVLENAPPEFNPIPRGTIALSRKAPK